MGDHTSTYARGQRSEQVYEKIRGLIVGGALSPGSRIVESELADRLGVSRTPVRSALHRLMQDGIIVGPSRGRQARLIVSPLTKRDGREIYQIIAVLDGLAAWAAAGLRAEVRGAIAADMRATNEELRAASAQESEHPARLMELHARIHDLYRRAIDAPRLGALFSNVKPQADRYRRIYSTGRMGDRVERSVAEHERMIRGIEAGDRAEAQQATQDNWMHAADRLCEAIDLFGEHGGW
jgi:DNA-binding GntR family transcriptional regulator